MILFLELKYTTTYKAFFQEFMCIVHLLWWLLCFQVGNCCVMVAPMWISCWIKCFHKLFALNIKRGNLICKEWNKKPWRKKSLYFSHTVKNGTKTRTATTRPSALGKSDPFCGPSNPWHLFTKDYTIFCRPSNPKYLFPKNYAIFFWQIIDINKKFCTVSINFLLQLFKFLGKILLSENFLSEIFLVKFFWVKFFG